MLSPTLSRPSAFAWRVFFENDALSMVYPEFVADHIETAYRSGTGFCRVIVNTYEYEIDLSSSTLLQDGCLSFYQRCVSMHDVFMRVVRIDMDKENAAPLASTPLEPDSVEALGGDAHAENAWLRKDGKRQKCVDVSVDAPTSVEARQANLARRALTMLESAPYPIDSCASANTSALDGTPAVRDCDEMTDGTRDVARECGPPTDGTIGAAPPAYTVVCSVCMRVLPDRTAGGRAGGRASIKAM